MDILLTYKGEKYIIETKVNFQDDVKWIIEEGVRQLSVKYLAAEGTDEGYLVVFDAKTPAGAVREPQSCQAGNKQVTIIIIAIGKPVLS